jgi:hypothetical protein
VTRSQATWRERAAAAHTAQPRNDACAEAQEKEKKRKRKRKE